MTVIRGRIHRSDFAIGFGSDGLGPMLSMMTEVAANGNDRSRLQIFNSFRSGKSQKKGTFRSEALLLIVLEISS